MFHIREGVRLGLQIRGLLVRMELAALLICMVSIMSIFVLLGHLVVG